MKTINLSPIQLSKITDMDVMVIVDALAKKLETRPSEIVPNKAYDCYGITLMKLTHLYGDAPIDMLGELVIQTNKYAKQLMMNVVKTKSCVNSISFAGDYKGYDQFLEPENLRMVIDKLAKCHVATYGNKTNEYRRYLAQKPS